MKKSKHTQISLFDLDSFVPSEEPEVPVEPAAVRSNPMQAESVPVTEAPVTDIPVNRTAETVAEWNAGEAALPVLEEAADHTPQPDFTVDDEMPATRTPAQEKSPIETSAPKPAVETLLRKPLEKPKVLYAPAPEVKPKSTRGRKSLKEMAESVHKVQVPADEILFQKSYYSIGKVAEMFQVNQSLIRLWEREFDVLKPRKNGKGDRFFRPEDIKNLQLIHHLTREKKYTMEGAKEFFRNNRKAEEKFAVIESLKKVRSFLVELKANL